MCLHGPIILHLIIWYIIIFDLISYIKKKTHLFVCSFVFSPGVPKLRPAKLQELAVTSRDLWTADRKTHKKVAWPSFFPTKEKKISKKIKLFSKENLQKVSTTCSVKLNIHLYNLSYTRTYCMYMNTFS